VAAHHIRTHMEEVTLALAILLGGGFLVAKLGQRIGLPSVTGYILAGVLLGPTSLGVISHDAIQHRLEHFTQIALMLIAFGIGEHLELRQLRRIAKTVSCIGICEASGAFLLVGVGTFLMAWITGVGPASWIVTDFAILGLLLGAVSVATAPAATLHVMRELKARGPLTSTVMAVVAVDDGLAIMIFGIAISVAHQVVGAGDSSAVHAIFESFTEIFGSLALGAFTGLVIDYVVHRLSRRGEMLTVGLALLLLCGEGARFLGLSPLLAGMAIGFTIVNRDRRDVRLFRAINAFEPPIFVLFFTLAGAHLDLTALAVGGWVGLVYFLLRGSGKLLGSNWGARLARAPEVVRRFLGLTLLPQAGVAIGLIFLIGSDSQLSPYATLITPIVLASVVISELVGPLCARRAVVSAGEAMAVVENREALPPEEPSRHPTRATAWPRTPSWKYGELNVPPHPRGVVAFALANPSTAPAMARLATLIAHYNDALPMAVRISTNADEDYSETRRLFQQARVEVEAMGYPLETQTIREESVPSGIVSVQKDHDLAGILLGHPPQGSAAELKLIETVARDIACQVVVVRFSGPFRTERILLAVTCLTELRSIENVIRSLSGVGQHKVTLLRLLPSGAPEDDLGKTRQELLDWAKEEHLSASVLCRSVASDARVETIVQESQEHDLVVMAATKSTGIQRLLFGSLQEDVAQRCEKPILIVNP